MGGTRCLRAAAGRPPRPDAVLRLTSRATTAARRSGCARSPRGSRAGWKATLERLLGEDRASRVATRVARTGCVRFGGPQCARWSQCPSARLLRGAELDDQRCPALGEQPALVGERWSAFTAAAHHEVVVQLVERGAEARRGDEIPEASQRVIALLDRPVALLGEVVQEALARCSTFRPTIQRITRG